MCLKVFLSYYSLLTVLKQSNLLACHVGLKLCNNNSTVKGHNCHFAHSVYHGVFKMAQLFEMNVVLP